MAYIEYNVNPKKRKVDDCAIRAIAVASGLTWDNIFELLVKIAFDYKCAPTDIEAVSIALNQLGFIEGKIKVTKGSKRPTVAEFAENYPNVYAILRVAGHLTCSGRGNYVDIWDCGDKSVYKYWYKPIQEFNHV